MLEQQVGKLLTLADGTKLIGDYHGLRIADDPHDNNYVFITGAGRMIQVLKAGEKPKDVVYYRAHRNELPVLGS